MLNKYRMLEAEDCLRGRNIVRTSNIGPRYPCSMLGFWSASPCSADMIPQLPRPKSRCRIRTEGSRVVSFRHPANRRCGRFAAEEWHPHTGFSCIVWVKRGGQSTRRRFGRVYCNSTALSAHHEARGAGLWMSSSSYTAKLCD